MSPAGGVPILCYHSISPAADHSLSQFGVAPAMLERQMGLLRRLKYQALTLRELVEAFEAGRPSRRAVVLTFDDGYLDTVTTAAPMLASYGFRATIFVVTDLVGQTAQWAAGRGGEQVRLANWDQIRSLHAAGWEVGLHSATHPDLTKLPAAALSGEIEQAARTLEQRIGAPRWSFAYPYGRHSPAVVDAVWEAGLQAAVTVSRSSISTPRSPRLAMPRYSMRRSDTLLDFLCLLTLGSRPGVLLRDMRRAALRWAAARRPRPWRS
jgi:peptidoglycan/xylan/chitin deacetylase (PgdA/CDA1 family)